MPLRSISGSDPKWDYIPESAFYANLQSGSMGPLHHNLYAISIVLITSANFIGSAAWMIGVATSFDGPLHQGNPCILKYKISTTLNHTARCHN